MNKCAIIGEMHNGMNVVGHNDIFSNIRVIA